MPDPVSDLPARRVLALEDEALILLSVEAVLSEAGYIVTAATTVRQALAYLDTHSFDAAVIDVRMKDGGHSFDVAAALALKKIPFVFCSASDVSMDSRYRHVVSIDKPFTDDSLISAVQALTWGPR